MDHDHDICALAEGMVATLIGRDWEARGFWRWELVRVDERGTQERRRVYYDTSRQGRVQRIPPADWPSRFRPLSALNTRPETPDVRPALEAPDDPHPSATLADIEARLLMAFRVDRVLPDREREMLRVRAYPLLTRPGPGDYPPEQQTTFRPTQAQVSDYLVAMGWIAGLPRSDIRILRWKAAGARYRTIAEEMRTNEHAVRRRYREIIVEAYRASLGVKDRRAQKSGTEGRVRDARRRGGVRVRG